MIKTLLDGKNVSLRTLTAVGADFNFRTRVRRWGMSQVGERL